MSNKIREIYGRIYDDNVENIYRFIFLKVNSQEIAQDLASETFLKGWEAFKKTGNSEHQEEIENPRAFLYKIARNLVIDHYREKDRTKVISADIVPIADPRPNVEEKVSSDSEISSVVSSLDCLKPEYKEILLLHYVEDISVREIAGIINKSEGAVRVTLHRALKSIKSELKEG